MVCALEEEQAAQVFCAFEEHVDRPKSVYIDGFRIAVKRDFFCAITAFVNSVMCCFALFLVVFFSSELSDPSSFLNAQLHKHTPHVMVINSSNTTNFGRSVVLAVYLWISWKELETDSRKWRV